MSAYGVVIGDLGRLARQPTVLKGIFTNVCDGSGWVLAYDQGKVQVNDLKKRMCVGKGR